MLLKGSCRSEPNRLPTLCSKEPVDEEGLNYCWNTEMGRHVVGRVCVTHRGCVRFLQHEVSLPFMTL